MSPFEWWLTALLVWCYFRIFPQILADYQTDEAKWQKVQKDTLQFEEKVRKPYRGLIVSKPFCLT